MLIFLKLNVTLSSWIRSDLLWFLEGVELHRIKPFTCQSFRWNYFSREIEWAVFTESLLTTMCLSASDGLTQRIERLVIDLLPSNIQIISFQFCENRKARNQTTNQIGRELITNLEKCLEIQTRKCKKYRHFVVAEDWRGLRSGRTANIYWDAWATDG